MLETRPDIASSLGLGPLAFQSPGTGAEVQEAWAL